MRPLVNVLNHNPVVRSLKNLRNQQVDRYFRAKNVPGTGQFVAALADDLNTTKGAEGVCFTIAYNTPWAIAFIASRWRQYCSDMVLAVVDNSSSPEKSREIEQICGDNQIRYLALPKNPEWNQNRSHGLALNWTFHNIVSAVKPPIFGFLDHDCFPFRKFSICKAMEGSKLYGYYKTSPTQPEKWNLWAGYCFYRFDRVGHLPLNFIHRVEWGLDTGGSNWKIVYDNVAKDELCKAEQTFDVSEYQGKTLQRKILDNSFFHCGGASHNGKYDEQSYFDHLIGRVTAMSELV